MSDSSLSDAPKSPPTISSKRSGGRKKTVPAYKDESSGLSSEEETKPVKKKTKLDNGSAQSKKKPAAKAKKPTENVTADDRDVDAKPATKKAAPKKREPKTDPFSSDAIASHPPRCGPPAAREPNPSAESKYHNASGPTHRIGAHTSAAGGIENALLNASQLGGRALALFLKNQRKWESSPLDADGVKKFRKLMLERDMGGKSETDDCLNDQC
jgi:hypothetical protein